MEFINRWLKEYDFNMPLSVICCIDNRTCENNIDTLIEYNMDKYIEEQLDADFDAEEDIPASVTSPVYFRVVITPGQVDDEDVVITSKNLAKYVNMISIVVAK